MIMFLASVIEQLDLALDQIVLNDPNYNRFALMLVDNAMELTLHRFAEDKDAENKMFARISQPRNDPKAVREALGHRFDAKVKLARTAQLLTDEEAASINTLHFYRNQVYHRGLEHEPILAALAMFYFRIVSGVLGKYQPHHYSLSSEDRIPHRARKYIGSNPMTSDVSKIFPEACCRLIEVSEGISFDLPRDLHDHMANTINAVDSSITFLAQDGPRQLSRDQVIVMVQAWPFAFSDEGKAYATRKKLKRKSRTAYADWLVKNYPWKVRADPIKPWEARLSSLKSEIDPHKALRKYHDFMSQTEELREQIGEAAMQLDMHIQQQIDIARGK